MRGLLILVAVFALALLPAMAAGPKPFTEGLFLTTQAQYYSGPVVGTGIGWHFRNGYTLSGSLDYGQLNSVKGTVPFRCYTVPYEVDDRRQAGFTLAFTVPLIRK